MKTLILSLILFTTNTFAYDLFDNNQSMYDTLKGHYLDNNSLDIPDFEEFQRIGDDDKNCIEVSADRPNHDEFVGIYLFVKHYAQRGPLFPARTIKKIIVDPKGGLETIFDKVTMNTHSLYLESSYQVNDDNHWKTRFKTRDDLIFFKREGKISKKKFRTYGYCYRYENL